MLKNQKYGVEIEFTGITRADAANVVAGVLNGTVSHRPYSGYDTRVIFDGQGRKWKIVFDSSIVPERNGRYASDLYKVEFVTPPLKYEDIELLQTIVRALRAAGGKANSSCGIHIHVDGANHNPTSMKRMIKFFSARQDLIFEGLNVASSRRDTYCKPISKTLKDTVSKERNLTTSKFESIWYSRANDNYCGGIDHSHYNYTRYHALNLHSFFTKGTVEFRLFNSTLHAGKIKAYIQFCLGVSAWAIKNEDGAKFQPIGNRTFAQRAYLWNSILNHRLGMNGDEFKTMRLHLTEGFRDNAEAVVA